MSQTGPYDDPYYLIHEAGSVRSAQVVLSHLFRWFVPRSVIDIGCGHGAWLAAAETLGSDILFGVDGPWVDETQLDSPSISFRPADLESDVELPDRYDLCISVEVAEHLAPERAAGFVEMLCGASDAVLFSAAPPHQSGLHHVNLQWPSFWASLFDERHFECLDLLRPLIWDNEQVDWWYRQNALLFVKRGSLTIAAIGSQPPTPILNIAHPALLASNAHDYQELLTNPTLRSCLAQLKRWLAHRVGLAGQSTASEG